MKRSQLEAIIREAFNEVLNEVDPTLQKDVDAKKRDAIEAEEKLLQAKKKELTKEGELDELANVAVRYQLAPDVTATDFPGKKGRIITAMQAAGEPMSKMDVAAEMGYNKQNPINADFMALVASGAIVPAGQQAAPRFNRPQPEPAAIPAIGDDEEEDDELPAGYEDPEGGVAGDMSDEEIEASFARMKAGGEDEEEIEDIEIAAASPSKGMSDEDFEAWMKYNELERRLNNVKSDLNKEKRGLRKGGIAGDIRGGGSIDLESLRDLKNRLQQKMDDLVASSPYLQASIAKGKNQPKIEPIDEPEELDEWTMNKMKYYAGIIK